MSLDLRLPAVLLHFLWQGAALALLAWASMALVRSPRVRYAIGCVALLAMLAAPIVTFTRMPTPQPVVVGNAPTADSQIADTAKTYARPAATASAAPALTSPEPTFAERTRLLFNAASPYITTTWLAGVALVTLRHAIGLAAIARLRRRATAALPDELRERRIRISLRLNLRRHIELLGSTSIDAPCVIGFLRPAILWPASAITGLSPLQLDALLAHELAHIRRHDYLINLLQVFIETLGFYHPAVWWLSRRVRQEREHCCDDIAANLIDDRVGYVEALTHFESLRHTPRLSVASDSGSLFHRVSRLLAPPKHHRPPAVGRLGMALLLAVLLIACVRMLHADPSTSTTPQSEMIVRARELAKTDLTLRQLIVRRDRLATPLRPEVQRRGADAKTIIDERDLLRVDLDTLLTERLKTIDAAGGVKPVTDAEKRWTEIQAERAAIRRDPAIEKQSKDRLRQLSIEANALVIGKGEYFIGGNVARPGVYGLVGPVDLRKAIRDAGGFDHPVADDGSEIWIDVIERDERSTDGQPPAELFATFALSDIQAGKHDDFSLRPHEMITVDTRPPQTTQPSPAVDVTPDDKPDYAIAAGDLLRIQIGDLSGAGADSILIKRVANSGVISLPYIGEIKAVGLSEIDFEKAIATAYQKAAVLSKAIVNVLVVEGSDGKRVPIALVSPSGTAAAADARVDEKADPSTSGTYYVAGIVGKPGAFKLDGQRVSVVQALIAAEMPSAFPAVGVRLSRRGQAAVYIRASLATGAGDDLFVQAGDTLFVGSNFRNGDPATMPATVPSAPQ